MWKRIESAKEITVEEIEQRFGCKVKIVSGENILYDGCSSKV
jgi:hypothetical protein